MGPNLGNRALRDDRQDGCTTEETALDTTPGSTRSLHAQDVGQAFEPVDTGLPETFGSDTRVQLLTFGLSGIMIPGIGVGYPE